MTMAANELLLAIGHSPLASLTIKATLTLLLGLLAAWFARNACAAVRHAILAASFAVLLALPTASIVAPPVRIKVRTPAPPLVLLEPAARLAYGLPATIPAAAVPGIALATASSRGLSFTTVLAAVWSAGAVLCLLSMAAALWQIGRLRRSGLPSLARQSTVARLAAEAGIRRPVEVLLHEAVPGPMTCGSIRPAIVLPPNALTWSNEELERAMIHELEHVRRCDHASHCLARLVCAVYWFHPLVWIAWRQLALEAERACDDAVLRRFEPAGYADQLVGLASRLSAAKSPLLAMANRADLGARIRAVLDSRQRRGRAGTLSLIAACSAAAVFAIVISPLGVTASQFAAAQDAPSNSRQAFATAEIRLAPATANPVLPLLLPGTDRFEMHGATMLDLIRVAWDVIPQRVVGGPAWLATNRFDVIATTGGAVTHVQAIAMLKALLADRFKLVVHEDTRPVTAFAMTIAKGGSKMKKAAPGAESGCDKRRDGGQDGLAVTTVTCRALTMSAFADALPGMALLYFLGNPVVDRTNLDGTWNFQFHYTERGATGAGATSLFEALEKQAGLRVASADTPLRVIVVDSVNEVPVGATPAGVEKPHATEFDAASLKPSPGDGGQLRLSLQGGKVDIHNAPLKTLITVSWDLTPDKIVGLPDFTDSDKYDILAVAPAGEGGIDTVRAMMRTLLTGRFAIKMHNEDRTVPVYALTSVKPKLQKADPGNRSECQNSINTSAAIVRSITCRNTSMEQMAAALKRMAGGYFSQNAVIDATGLEGAYDFTLSFSPASMVPSDGNVDPNGAISIFDAVQKQLGLKLETQKRPMPVLVVDHIERKAAAN